MRPTVLQLRNVGTEGAEGLPSCTYAEPANPDPKKNYSSVKTTLAEKASDKLMKQKAERFGQSALESGSHLLKSAGATFEINVLGIEVDFASYQVE